MTAALAALATVPAPPIADHLHETSAPVLLPYQQRWVADASPVKVAEKSRRVGLTWAEAADDVLFSASAEGDDTLYVGYNQDIAKEFIRTCADWARAYNQVAGEIDEFLFKDRDKDGNERDIQAYRIRFASTHEIVALSSRPTNIRGRQGRVVLDEFAFHGEQKELLKAALALLIWGGSVRIISTHDGDDNEFNQLIEEIRKGRLDYGLHRITFDDALNDGLYQRICAKRKMPWSADGEAAFRARIIKDYGAGADEELFCIPRAGGGAYLLATLIEQRMVDGIPVVRWAQPADFTLLAKDLREAVTRDFCTQHLLPLLQQLDPNQPHALGEDFGRTGDLTVLWPLAIERNLVKRTPFVVELRNIPFEQQAQVVSFVLERLPRFFAACFDARGNGSYLAEVTMQKFGAERITQVMLTTEYYREHMPRFKRHFEDAEIVIPRDQDILTDLRAISIEGGVPKVHDKKRSLGLDGFLRHADAAIAAFLACVAAAAPIVEYGYESARAAAATNPERAPVDDDRPREFAPSLHLGRGAC